MNRGGSRMRKRLSCGLPCEIKKGDFVKITDVRITAKESGDKKLKAFASITFDGCFVVRDIKIIDRGDGFFVAMPSRKAKLPCSKCKSFNSAHSNFCNFCGTKLTPPRPETNEPEDLTAARHKLHKDVAHPITPECRLYIEKTVLQAFHNSDLVKK